MKRILLALILAATVRAEVSLSPPFCDGAVLQRDKPIRVWGMAAPGEHVTVRLGADQADGTTTTADGHWRVTLPPRGASETPVELIAQGTNRVVVHDIVIGEVWLCAGQSNMMMAARTAQDAEREAAAANYPLIRQFKVPSRFADTPQASVDSKWEACTPKTFGSFSAVTIFFARALWRELGVPVGILNASYGNTPIASWREPAAIAAEPVVNEWWAGQVGHHPRPHRKPSSCYNGMVHPLEPYVVRGALWYQGESDATETALTPIYGRQFAGLIEEWRRAFEAPDLPFFWVQLPGYGKAGPRGWVALREQQTQVLRLHDTGQAIALDVGDATNIHPKNKQAVGDRLARLALHRVYGRAMEDTGPEPVRVTREGAMVRIEFAHAAGLSAQGDVARAFELAAGDGRFVPAVDVRIDGAAVWVRANAMTQPAYVRFAWQDLPPGFLHNAAGLPAGPFRREIAHASSDLTVPLSGPWSFAMDPLDRGAQLGWFAPDPAGGGKAPSAGAGWDTVTVPHDYLSDPRYNYTGVAWYRRSFLVPSGPATARAWRLRFEQVSQRCRVWLNGTYVGAHEGGYTPFEFVVTPQVTPGRENFLVVAVDNRVRLRSLPGARSGNTPSAQIYPWLNYGGILGSVTLLGHAPVYIVRQQIEATPQPDGSADFVSHVLVHNAATESRPADVAVDVDAGLNLKQTVTIPPETEQVVTLHGALREAKPWSLDAQPLYTARATVRSAGDEYSVRDRFGVRSIVARGGRLLLNGRPVRWAGANRARGGPTYGGLDPDEAVKRDMTLMKQAGLRLARLQHTPPHENLLNWADENGMLLILEVGVWGYPAADLGSAELRHQFKAEMGELIAMAANHPSVIGWSVGNEYESWTPEGIAWTRDMTAYVKSLDATRPVTFAAIGTALRRLHDHSDPAGPHAFDYVDLVCANDYFPPQQAAAYLDPIHERWPDKPVLISEFGLRADQKTEDQRIANFDQLLAVVRARPWICGLSYWSFNDYPSHYPHSGPDGYRRWGLVDEFRRPRPLYDHIRAAVAHGLP